jgi:PTS system cellobiose-specific IIA component
MTDNQTMSWEQTLFNIILHAGNARSKALAAAEEAEKGNYVEAETVLAEAEVEQAEAHKVHAKVIQMEAGGEQVPFSVLLIHSMDLLLLSWAEIDHTRQMIGLLKRVSNLEREAKKWQKK